MLDLARRLLIAKGTITRCPAWTSGAHALPRRPALHLHGGHEKGAAQRAAPSEKR